MAAAARRATLLWWSYLARAHTPPGGAAVTQKDIIVTKPDYLWLPFPVPMVEFEGVEVTEHIDESELLSLLILLAETAAVHVDNKDFSRL